MALVMKGAEFVSTGALSASVLLGLVRLARHRPLLINGVEFYAQDLATLAEEAERTGRSVWPRSAEGAAPKAAPRPLKR